MVTRERAPVKEAPTADLEGDLFVGGPFAVDIRFEGGDGFQDLGRGSSRVAGGHGDARLVGPAGNRLIAGEQFGFWCHNEYPMNDGPLT